MDLFSYDAAQQHEERKAARTASVLFNLRASERFESFLRQSANRDEFRARLTLLDNDLSDLVVEVAKESGWDGEPLPQGVNPIVTAFIHRIAAGAFCDNCHKWKSGPKAGTCDCDTEEDGALSDDVSAVGKASNNGDYSDQNSQPVKVVDVGSDDEEEDEDEEKNSSTRTAEDNLGGNGTPSPKIDKAHKSPGKVPKTDGGPFKSEMQDVSDKPDWGNDKRAYGEKLETNTDITKEDKQPVHHTDTWTGTKGQADPVTSSFLTPAQVTAAINGSAGI